MILSVIALALFAGACVLVARAMVLPRMQAARQVEGIARYGFSPPAALVSRPAERGPAFGALAAGIGRLMARRFGGIRPDALRRELVAAGIYGLTPLALLGYRVIATLGLGLLGVALTAGSTLLFILAIGGILAASGWVAPLFVLRSRSRRRLSEIDRTLPDLIDLLVVTVEAGSGLGASLAVATRKFEGPLADELRLTLQEQRMGRSLREALLGMLQRVDTPNMRAFVRSVTQGEALGVSIGTIMRNLAEEMRMRRRASAQERAQKAPVKILFPLVFLILPAFMLTILGPPIARLAGSFG